MTARPLTAATGATHIATNGTANRITGSHPSQRLGRKYCFDDPDMDLFFMAAASWGPSGGLDLGQVYYIASQITDGDGDSWMKAFSAYGDAMDAQADAWLRKTWHREAGEARMKAFAAYRSAWQFAAPGEAFARMVARHKQTFAQAVDEQRLPATFFEVPYAGKSLPGVFLQNEDADAPVVLVIGGADTCFEDLYLSLGRNLLMRGYSVAMADLPGQGITMKDGLHWEAEAEKPIAAVTKLLVERFGAKPGRMALIGLSLGGYFVARAAGAPGLSEHFATVIASTPFPNPAELFALSAQAAVEANTQAAPTPAATRSRMVSLWKAGAKTPEEFVPKTAGMVADPTRVTLPFLSILGAGDSQVFARQARAWHEQIRSTRKSFVLLDAASGADGHVQVNNRLRLCQECVGWMGEIFNRSQA
nr:alpha/beta fold hydrolase [uncultured Roseateles sp.]